MAALGFDFSLILVYFVNFAVLLWLLNRFAYGPILNILEERKQKIADGLAAADKVRAEAAEEQARLQAEFEEARATSQEEASQIAKATAEMREGILAEAREEAEAIKAKAREDIEAERELMLAEMKRQMADLTVQLTDKLVGKSLTEKKQHDLVGQFLNEMGD